MKGLSKMIGKLTPEECCNCISDYVVIDVRREDEFYQDYGHIENSKLLTLETDFQSEVSDLSKDKKYLFVCRTGRRSMVAAQIAYENGIENVTNLMGGMVAWTEQGLPVIEPKA